MSIIRRIAPLPDCIHETKTEHKIRESAAEILLKVEMLPDYLYIIADP
jgi:hypothetical protein